jgi:precorrin-6A synthase
MNDRAAVRVNVIGIGLGSPDQLTGQAIEALREVDVFLIADKGEVKEEPVVLRRAICERFRAPGSYRIVTVPDPVRTPDAQRRGAAYAEGITDWHAARTNAYVEVITGLPAGSVVGFLVWGDPAFYDSTIRVVDAIGARLPVRKRVVPGISAFQALAAEHGIVLHAVGAPVHVTTGRRLVREWSADLGTVVVMLDGHLACRELVGAAGDLMIHWGAYVGMRQQVLRSGRLGEVIDDIVETRARLREEHGWVMDVYALGAPG